MILCARSTSRSREQSTKRRLRSERTCKRLTYSIVKITRLYDYQRWQTHLFWEMHEVRKAIGWAGKLRSDGSECPERIK